MLSLKCLLGRHQYGLPRTDELGVLVTECLLCLRVARSSVALPRDTEALRALDERRSRAIANLVAEKLWVGMPASPELSEEVALAEAAAEASAPRLTLLERKAS